MLCAATGQRRCVATVENVIAAALERAKGTPCLFDHLEKADAHALFQEVPYAVKATTTF